MQGKSNLCYVFVDRENYNEQKYIKCIGTYKPPNESTIKDLCGAVTYLPSNLINI